MATQAVNLDNFHPLPLVSEIVDVQGISWVDGLVEPAPLRRGFGLLIAARPL